MKSLKNYRIILLFLVSILLLSCNNKTNDRAVDIVSSIQDDPACAKSVDLVWKSMYSLEEQGLSLTEDSETLSANLTLELESQLDSYGLDQDSLEAFVKKYEVFYKAIASIQKQSKASNWVKRLGLIQFESLASGLDEMEVSDVNLMAYAAANELDKIRPACTQELVNKGTFIEKLKNDNHPLVYGAKKVFLTAYQDCNLLNKKPLTKNSYSVEGVAEYGDKFPDGMGSRRYIADSEKLYNSHHYYGYKPLTGRNISSLGASGFCLDQKKHLMIYDYGGKPASSTKKNTYLNMFRNAVKEASPDLGTDCSGFVFSALASAGLKLRPDKKMLATHVYMIGANNFRSSSSKKSSIVYMPCLQKVNMDQDSNLKPGDIISTKDHTLIVGGVGEDPLGINKAYKKNRCSSITYKDFDYDQYHSDPGKGAIGIHHITAQGHLAYSSGMRSSLEALAQEICQNSREGKKTLSRLYKEHKISITRHKNTPECKGPEVSLTAESCLNECN